MVVPVLITSCQVLENPKKGPVKAHTITKRKAITDATGLPEILVTAIENR